MSSKIKDVICAIGRAGYFHMDLAAAKSGAVPDGFVYRGTPVTPGFREIVEPAEAISVMLLLDDGQVAFGDCCDVVFAGASGRDPLLRGPEGMAWLEGTVAEQLRGRALSSFKALADEMDGLTLDGRRLPLALRYGVTQALLNAVALAERETMTEVLARDYGTSPSPVPIKVSVSCEPNNDLQFDRMVLKRPDILPHTYFTDTDELGPDGSGLVDYVSRMSARVAAIGGEGYRPSLHLDFYGMLGDLYDQDLEKVVSLIGRAADAAAPLPLLIETPILEASQDRQIARMNILKRRLRQSGIQAELIADDWCNTLDDIRKFCAGEASDYVQIKMPDLGGINHSIEAVLHCKTHGMGAFLGGSANETDQSARISVHIALASSPAFIGSKPGLGGDEALMIQFNEMSRTLALIASKPWRAVV